MNEQNATNDSYVLVAEHVARAYHDGVNAVPVLKDVCLKVKRGETLAILGASGSGKSTLLHALGGVDKLDSGTVKIAGESLSGLSESARGELRNRHLGFVYQFHHLLAEFSALDNAAMPLFIRRMERKAARVRAQLALEAIGLGHRLEHLPSQLSGGERQRTAIARALVTEPDCILADEPTGNLDADTAAQVFESFLALAHRRGTAIVIVTHDQALAKRCDRVVRLVDGEIHPVDG